MCLSDTAQLLSLQSRKGTLQKASPYLQHGVIFDMVLSKYYYIQTIDPGTQEAIMTQNRANAPPKTIKYILFIIAKLRNHLKYPTMDKENMVHRHNGTLFTFLKERNPIICDNMDGTGEYNAK